MLELGALVGVEDHGRGIIQDVTGNVASVVLEGGATVSVPISALSLDVPYLEFKCDITRGGCGHKLEFKIRLGPGQAANVKCSNCGESWTVYQPSLEVHKTANFELIWSYIAQ